MHVLYFLSAIVLGALFRAVMMIAQNSDEDVSLWLIQRQSGRCWVNYGVSDSVIAGYYGYPVLVHWAVSKFPDASRFFLGRLFNILPDLLTGVAVWFIALAGAGSLSLPTQQGNLLSAAAVLLYLTAPILIPAHLSRMKTIKSRSWGCFFVFLYLVSAYRFCAGQHPLAFATAVGCGVLAVLASMFALQTLVLFSGILSALLFRWEFLLLAASVFAVCLLVPFLRAREPIVFYFHHKWWYFRNFDKGTTAAPRTNLQNALRLPCYLIHEPKKFIWLITTALPPAIVVLSFPEAVALAAVLAMKPGAPGALDPALFRFCLAVGTASAIVFILVCFRRFSFIGQAERYFEYSAPFIAVLVPFVFASRFGTAVALQWLFFFLILHAVVNLFHLLVAHRGRFLDGSATTDAALLEAAEFLFSQAGGGIVFTVPCKLGFRLSYLAGEGGVSGRFRFFYKFIKRSGENGFRYYEEATGGLGPDILPSKEVLKLTPSELSARYGADYLLVTKGYLPGLKKQWGDAFEAKGVLFENSKYMIFRLK
jgi:hypothetical protein